MSKKIVVATLSVALLATSLVVHAQEPRVRVGVTLGFTGPADRWSKFQRMGIELAAEDLQKEGHKIDLIFEDSQSKPRQSLSIFNKFVAVDKVNGED